MDICISTVMKAAGYLVLGRVVTLSAGGGTALVAVDGGTLVSCGILDNAGCSALREGDEVLVWQNGGVEERAIVMGRIRKAQGAEPISEAGEEGDTEQGRADPDELVIQARKSLTLRVGDGSITIRKDGRILIKGRELVSHAKGMNRIRGGSVAIN
jgi:hypothetical protein